VGTWEPACGASDEWYTPGYIFDALGCRFDLDVASPKRRDFSCVPATRFISAGSLELPWRGFIWMNPPFGGPNGLVPWLDKFFEHGNGIALTPDRTSAAWFQDAWSRADTVLFTARKVKFVRPDGAVGQRPSNGTALFAAGERGVAALGRAARHGLGIIAAPQAEAA